MLQKNLGFSQALALYLAAVLGTGILIIPLLAWQEGGPASLIAWLILGFLGLALAWTFASVIGKMPDAGGIQAIIGRVFGPTLESLSKYLIFFSVPAGAVAGAYIFANHLAAAFILPDRFIPYLAFASWVLVAAVNYFGIRVSAGVQLILSALLVALLGVFITIAIPDVQASEFVPFSPSGLKGIGNAALLIFWSFLGWEAIAHLAEEFRDPKRDMLRSAVTAAVIVAIFYFAISFVLIGIGIFNINAGQNAPLVEMAQRKFGNLGRIFTGFLAAVICLGTMNAYMAGLSRLSYAMSRNGDLPQFLSKLDSTTRTPKYSVLFLLSLNLLALSIQLIFRLPLHHFFLIQNVAFLFLYIFGSLAAARLLRDQPAAASAAYISAAICAVMLPFASGLLFYPIVVSAAALIRIYLKRRKVSQQDPHSHSIPCCGE